MNRYKDMNEVSAALAGGETNEELDNLMAGVYAYGRERVNELLAQARQDETKLVFFYASDDDMEADILSFKFVDESNN